MLICLDRGSQTLDPLFHYIRLSHIDLSPVARHVGWLSFYRDDRKGGSRDKLQGPYYVAYVFVFLGSVSDVIC